MNSGAPPKLQLAILTREGFEDIDIAVADIPKLLMDLAKGVAFEITVYPVDQMKQFPRIHLDWHQPHGFVVMAFENEQSIGFYPIVGTRTGRPEVPIELGGQALETGHASCSCHTILLLASFIPSCKQVVKTTQ